MKLLKDIDWKPNSEGDICVRSEFKKIIPAPLLKAVLILYDLNIRTVSCGMGDDFGISIDYDCLSEENKKIADEYMKRKKMELSKPCAHAPERRFRLGVKIDENKVGEKQAEKLILKELEDLGLKKQDVMYGFSSMQDKIRQWKDVDLDVTDDILIDSYKEVYFVDENNVVWENEELYNKHIAYENELNIQNNQTI